jgi:hypothetical protein
MIYFMVYVIIYIFNYVFIVTLITNYMAQYIPFDAIKCNIDRKINFTSNGRNPI